MRKNGHVNLLPASPYSPCFRGRVSLIHTPEGGGRCSYSLPPSGYSPYRGGGRRPEEYDYLFRWLAPGVRGYCFSSVSGMLPLPSTYFQPVPDSFSFMAFIAVSHVIEPSTFVVSPLPA